MGLRHNLFALLARDRCYFWTACPFAGPSPTDPLPVADMRLAVLTLLALFSTAPLFAQQAPAQDSAHADASGWDVTRAHGPTQPVRFTTDEGTWMTVDVSPDGQTLVFDLLGDLYTLPRGGGQATRITSGPAYDVQPQFSPDGTRIAFTSDRDGGDNLWTIGVDGQNAQQVTDESFRLVNGPAWTPDGEYLLGRKHFTSTRSLGAGEIWMYHRTGGAGLRLTERRNDQKDQGNEIALSPDGRFIYHAEDVTPGSTFEYNKDPNPGIYAIKRLDRETGETETIIGGAGGASRPVPDPSGEQLAYVRRVRGETVLYVYNFDSGISRPLWDGLDHDQQEAWAIFGTYPDFAWTPDGREIVLWAGGKLWAVDAQTRAVTNIPFSADVDLTVAETVRFPVQVHADRFDARMITDAATSPDGRWLVFHAVGQLWKKRLPEGAPQPLTSGDAFAYEPAFSPDGQWIAFTTWDDEALGAVYRVRLSGGTPEKLTTRPGYYREPRYSPDGQKIVVRREGGNNLLGVAYGTNTGIFWLPAQGGALTEVRGSGSSARFDATGTRILFTQGGGLDKSLRSVRLDGGDERTHFTTTYANNIVPSPDGKWVAWTELFNVYVAPFPRTGGPITLSREMKALPVKQLTRDAGTELHWSADGETLQWMLGDTYFSRRLDASFPFVAGAPDEIAPPDTTGIPIGLQFDTHVPEGSVAFTNARIVTMRGDEVIDNGTLVVTRNRVVALGAAGAVAIPEGARVIDAAGKTILPGFIDVHAHASHFSDGPTPQQNWPYYANLAYGVTTLHDPSANTDFVFRQSELQKAGEIVAPRVFSTGTILYGADGDFKALVNSLDDARSHLRRLKAVGAVSVKSYNQPRRDQRQQILQAAREMEMQVVPEGGSTFFTNMTQVIDGHTGIEHNIPVAPLYRDVLEVWRHTSVGYTPTLVVNYGGPSGEYYWYQHTDVWQKERLLRFTPRPVVDARSRRPVQVPEEEYHHIAVAAQAKKLIDQGNLVQVGAHGQLQGLAFHWEMWMLGQGGFTPHEALRAATLNGAQYLGLDGELGSLEPGKLADLVIVDGNPLADLFATENVAYVMVNGRLFDAATMNEVGGRERQPFWWERGEANDAFIWSPSLSLGHGEGQEAACSCGRH